MSRKWEDPKKLAKHLGNNVYGGQSNAAKHIIPLLPAGTKIVEPFAGHGHVALKAMKEGKFEKAVFGDVNCSALRWIKNNRNTSAIMKCQDWKATVRQNDSPDTVFVFDPPWKAVNKCYTAYKGNCTNFAPQIVEAAEHMKGSAVLLLGDTPEHRELVCKRTGVFKCHTITVDSHIFGHPSLWKEIVAVKKAS